MVGSYLTLQLASCRYCVLNKMCFLLFSAFGLEQAPRTEIDKNRDG